ncbi:MAG: 50S ribosomal protein L6, partial [Candidatus Kapaibacterium sp.]
MSRVGKKIITIPAGVQVSLSNGEVHAKGPKGELQVTISSEISCQLENNVLSFSRNSDEKSVRALHGMTRALVANAIEGVTNGFQKQLQIEGVG